ncbi:MAG: DUF4258 domain-containing protein [Ferruginibacter sp.]
MLKKYLPLILLIAAGMLFFWVKKNQRGASVHIPIETQNFPAGAEPPVDENAPFDRNIAKIVYSKHAHCRMDCRHIDESEVKEILKQGVINYTKVEETEKGKTYPLEGMTHDKQHVRIVIAPHADELVVVTVIDLDKEWECNCK